MAKPLAALTQRFIDILDGAGGLPSPFATFADRMKVGTRLDQVDPKSAFKSSTQTGTGSAQNVAHGLGYTPDIVIVVPQTGHDGAGSAGVEFPDWTVGTHTDTNVVVTVDNGAEFVVYAW